MCGDCMDDAFAVSCPILAESNWNRLVHTRRQRLINGLIRSCGETAHVQLKLHRDAHVTVAAFLWWE
jgi:hypothetical protein